MFFHSFSLQDPRIPFSYRPRFSYGQVALREEEIMLKVSILLCS